MAITFRHDAAGVVPPSNQTTRKYGQSLVLQQQQQKYDSQQAGYDRMFDAYKMENQNQIQQQRDWQQRDFVLNRDRDQNKLQQQQQRAADFTAARARMDTYAKDALSNPDLPPQLRQQIQNLVSGKMVAMGSGFNETQQQQFLDQYNAELAKLLSEVPAPKPQPTASDKFNQRKHFDEESGQWFIENSKGDFVPLVDPRQQQQQEKLQQQQLQQQEQEAEKMRPKSAQEYYADPANDGKYEKDLDATMSRLDDERMSRMAANKDLKLPEVTEDDAWNDMQTRYDAKQKRLGKPQYGEPTLAPTTGSSRSAGIQPATIAPPSLDVLPTPAAPPGEMKSILEQPPLAGQQTSPPGQPAAPTPGQPVVDPRDLHPSDPRSGYTLVTPSNGGKPFWYHPGPKGTPIDAPLDPGPTSPTQPGSPYMPKEVYDQMVAANGTGRMPYGGFISNVPLDAAFFAPNVPQRGQGDWDALAAGQGLVDMGPAGTAPATPNPTGQPTPAAQKASQQGDASNYPWLRQPGQLMQGNQAGASQPAPKASSGKASTVPNFGALASQADGVNKQAITALQGIYQSQTPDVQSAIGVLLNPGSPNADAAKALAYLQSKGIDMKSLTATSKPTTQYRALGAGGR